MRAWLVLGVMLPLAAWAQTRDFEGNSASAGRADEVQVQLPDYPKPENYLPLSVSATTTFDFFVDAKSVSVVQDQVVRYSLVAKSAEGALNVSYEGIRCSSREFRIYAYGRSDKSWSEARASKWQPIPSDTRNAQRAILHGEYFCARNSVNKTTAEILRALQYGPPSRSGL